jgi:hypothetical protein
MGASDSRANIHGHCMKWLSVAGCSRLCVLGHLGSWRVDARVEIIGVF